jgi:hypothetical protein
MLERVCPELPLLVRRARYLLVTELLFHGIADFGRLSTLEPPLFPPSSRDLFLSNLVDVLTALATASVSAETTSLLPTAPRGEAAFTPAGTASKP